MNSIVVESIYNLLNSKRIAELEIVLNWFEKGEYKNDNEVKAQLKEAIKKEPISISDTLPKEKELLNKIIEKLN
ncbi:MAG TPA: hypothetical protein VJY62_16885 [Bacteroidia bacterium]|nr:hypothetical protein [Bacteroidia bacterium]